jgi:hypothetical protein
LALLFFFLEEQETTVIQGPRVAPNIVVVSVDSGVEPHTVIGMVLVDSVVNLLNTPITSSLELLFSVTISARLP